MELNYIIYRIIPGLIISFFSTLALPLYAQQVKSVPEIKLESPLPADSLNNSGLMTLKADIISDAPLLSFSIIDNEQVDAATAAIKPQKSGSNTYHIESFLPLKKGINAIYLSATNAYGKGVSEKRIIRSQIEPFITWISPSSPVFKVESGTVKISAEIRTDLQPLKITFFNDAEAVTIDKSELSHPLPNIWLIERTVFIKQGKNNLYITVENSKGKTKSVNRVVNFGTGPDITILSPLKSDTLNNSGLITLKAELRSIVELQACRIYTNGELSMKESVIKPRKTEANKYLVECFVPLKAGDNQIYLEAVNSLGITQSSVINVISQPEPFLFWILPPSSATIFEKGDIPVKVEIKSDYDLKNASINLNGKQYEALPDEIKKAENGNFMLEKVIQLNPGRNSLYASATNLKGMGKSLLRTVSLGSVPVISIISPSIADSLNNTGIVTLYAEIISASPVQIVKVYNKGSTSVTDVVAKPIPGKPNSYSYQCIVELKGGINTITVEAKNGLGTAVSDPRSVYSQPEPYVTWIFPTVTNWVTEQGRMKLEAEIRTEVDLKNIYIDINGEQEPVESQYIKHPEKNIYLVEKNIDLSKDRNTILLEAENLRGITKSQPRYISIMSSPPAFSITNPPLSDSLNNSGIILLNAEIKSTSALQGVRIYNNRVLVSGEKALKPEKKDSVTWVIQSFIPMQAGKNTFYLEAKNSIGSSTSERRVVRCSLEPIVKLITPSSLTSTTGAEKMKIRAEIRTGFFLLKASLFLNGRAIEPGKDDFKSTGGDTYIYEKDITLSNGSNTLLLKAENAKGSGQSATFSIRYLPETISEIRWKNPDRDLIEIYKPDYPISASIKTKLKVEKTTLSLNGREVTTSDPGKLTARSPEEYDYTRIITLIPGDNNVELSVLTEVGTINSERIVIRYRQPVIPSLSWQYPQNEQSEVNDSLYFISMNIKSDISLDKVSIIVNGTELENPGLMNITKKDDGNYTFERKVYLVPGDNKISIVAKSEAGIANSETRAIRYMLPVSKPVVQVTAEKPVINTEAPAIRWVSPSNPTSDINVNSARIKAVITTTVKPVSVLLYVNGTASEVADQLTLTGVQNEYYCEKQISLQPEQNVLYLVATNNTGTTKSELRYLTNPPTTPPVITWSVPSITNMVVNNELVMVEACIKSATDLKSAQIFVNGVQQANETTFVQPLPGDCNYRFSKPVILKEGDNSVIIIATNFAGSKNSEPRVLRFQTAIVAEKRLALVIGNSDYTTGALKNPVNDANLMEATLKSLGFDVIKKVNSSKAEMESAIREFSDKLSEYNVALFYYAGHGVQVSGQNYLIPVDATLTKPTDCQWDAIDVSRITQQFEQVPENTNILILDACRNNPFRSWTRGAAQGFKALGTVRGTFIAYATSEGSTAADGTGLNGIYTEELVKQMTVSQTIESVFKKTRKQVMDRSGGQQIPVEWSYLTGDFFFKK